MVIFLIFGTFFGSGFSSGSEIVVYFSRFGKMSYFYILIAGMLLFFVLYFFLVFGKKVVKRIESSKILNFIAFFTSLVFAASMVAGVISLFDYFSKILSIFVLAVILVATFFCVKNGVSGLEKANFVLMPITASAFLVVLVFALNFRSDVEICVSSWAGALYCPLYVTLNAVMGGTLIASAGADMTKKQAVFSSLFSTLILVGFLFLGNFVLQNNSQSFVSDMPFLTIVDGSPLAFFLAFVVILIGCFTTLISLCFSLKSSISRYFQNASTSTFLSVVLPLSLSFCGFSQIVVNLYPICSVLGLFVVSFAIASLKQADKPIHPKGKHTKNCRCRHD